jgi:predicted DNA-binding protein with PD1-like motif
MIVVQSNAGRRLTGNIGGNVDLFTGLFEVCKNHGVRTGELRGIGYLRDVRLAVFDAAADKMVEDDTLMPSAQCLSLLGNISTAPEGPSYHLQAIVTVQGPDGGQTLRGGRLLSAVVVDLEFFIVALDDYGLVRGPASAGIAPWIQIETHGHAAAPTHQPEPTTDGRGRATGRPDLVGGRLAPRPDDAEPSYEMKVGDVLDHPRLGRCVVSEVKDEDSVAVRVDNGMPRELRLSLFKLNLKGIDAAGHRQFSVEMRRKV